MKLMKRMWSGAIVLLLLAIMILPACSSSDNGKVTITQYTLDTDDKAYIEKLVPEFEKLNPNIKVNILKAPLNEYDSKLQNLVASKQAPDVTSHFGNGGFIEYYNKGLVREMTDLLEGFKPEEYGLPQNLMDIYKQNGKVYGIPVYSYVSLLMYNKDLFDKAGLPYPPSDYEDKSWTWDKMLEYAKKLTHVTESPNDTTYGLDWFWGEKDMRPVYFNAKVYSDDTWNNGGKPSEVYFNSPEVIAANQKINDLVFKDKVMAPNAFNQAIAGQDGDPFATGKIGMSVGGAWNLAAAKDFSFKVGVAAVPAGPNPKVRDVLYVDPLFILKDSKHPKEAFEWIKFQLKKDIQEKSIELSGGTPPANQQALDKYFSFFPTVEPKDLKNVVEGGIKYGVESYNHVITNYSELLTIVKNEMDPLDNGKKQAADVAPELQSKISELFKVGKK
ncbi:sugar ABC transporter substrate-binding protein [Paenibacillus sp. N1-5-1-14]|uniref:ABC transporter substrate-binding protein n=1 Tax=Paenibacillus radicibacter TaxID=2972488 RepID=UPI002159424A|nr:sugar ABC transporter substrate-binding protein [Paenibacillus radicibacter]MCR8643331.1 sugar ABC transporter substrate-binding protein [Paenibacillus radicibacter]